MQQGGRRGDWRDATADTIAALSARGIDEIQALILPEEERYGLGLSRMVEKLRPACVLASEKAVNNGLLCGVDAALVHSEAEQVSLGELSVVPMQNNTGFLIDFPDFQLYYAHSRMPEDSWDWVIYAADLLVEDAAVVKNKAAQTCLSQTAVLQVSSSDVQLFCPQWIF